MDAPQCIELVVPAQMLSKANASEAGDVDIKFGWIASDPFAISMVFEEANDEVPWCASIDLFTNALIDEAHGWHGEGDVSVQFSDNVCYVALHGDHERSAVIAHMSAIGLAPFVDRVKRLRIVHAEYIAWLINKELDELLEAA